jgi:hypothetical protein
MVLEQTTSEESPGAAVFLLELNRLCPHASAFHLASLQTVWVKYGTARHACTFAIPSANDCLWNSLVSTRRNFILTYLEKIRPVNCVPGN